MCMWDWSSLNNVLFLNFLQLSAIMKIKQHKNKNLSKYLFYVLLLFFKFCLEKTIIDKSNNVMKPTINFQLSSTIWMDYQFYYYFKWKFQNLHLFFGKKWPNCFTHVHIEYIICSICSIALYQIINKKFKRSN